MSVQQAADPSMGDMDGRMTEGEPGQCPRMAGRVVRQRGRDVGRHSRRTCCVSTAAEGTPITHVPPMRLSLCYTATRCSIM